jgi:hypothetical protein
VIVLCHRCEQPADYEVPPVKLIPHPGADDDLELHYVPRFFVPTLEMGRPHLVCVHCADDFEMAAWFGSTAFTDGGFLAYN